jgi:hypothetical protein
MATTGICLNDRNWFVNGGVRSCTAEERVVWLEILMLMSKAETRGMLAKPLERIAVMAGTGVEVLCSLISNGLLKGRDGPPEFPVDDVRQSIPFVYRPRHAGKLGPAVTLIAENDGPIWYCDWMVLENYRSERASCGVKAAIESRGKGPGLDEGSRPAADPGLVRPAEGANAAGDAHGENDDESQGGRKVPNCPQARLVDMYHRIIPAAKKAVMVGPGNQLSKALKVRWRSLAVASDGQFTGYTSAEDGLKKWEAIFRHVARSRFLMGLLPGRAGEAPFELSLMWLLGPKNMEKVLNNVYNRTAEERGEVPEGASMVSGMQHRVMTGVEQVIALQRRRQGRMPESMQETLPL